MKLGLKNRIIFFVQKNALLLAHQDQVDLVFPFAFLKLESVPSDLGGKLIITGTWQLQ